MKTIRLSFKAFCAFSALIFMLGYSPVAKAQYNQDNMYGDGEPNSQTFYDDLSQYGQWIQDPQYGYVWVPQVENDFRPYYTGGHWAMTEYGNTWVSDYPWGWAAFHYGRWTYNPYYGWVWIPGNTWGPAWVGWRYGGGYYGWAPLGPGFEFGANFGNYNCPDDWWIFLAPTYLYERHYYRYWYGPRENGTIIRNTRFINNTYVNNNVTYVIGPRSTEVHRLTGRQVPMYHLRSSPSRTSTSINGRELRMYHPLQVKETGFNGTRLAPRNVVKAPENIGKPRETGFTNNKPTFRTEINNNTIKPMATPNRQEVNTLPIAPIRKEVTPKHNIQTDEHVTPQVQPIQPARPIEAPNNFNNNRPQGAEHVPQYNNQNNLPPVQQPQPQRYSPPVQQQPQPQRYNPPAQQQPQPQRAPQQAPQQARPERQAPPRNEPAQRR